MKELSIFIDESGDFGEYATHSPFYIITMVFHDQYEEFLSFDEVKLYYDNGQIEVSKMLSSVFNALRPNPTFRRVMPKEYKLLQVADLLCSMELVRLKIEHNLFSTL
ncbi:MAG: DUF3800 domain-containing protein [Lachnospiraceae bacterium]|nr:DUF3800 domain-containing protein [Lachnospiraceae bacterium]